MINGTQNHNDKLGKLERFAIGVNNHVGTIEFTIGCLILVTIPLIRPSTQTAIFYISSGYLQLLLLPLIVMGGNIQSKHIEEIEKAHFYNLQEHEKKIEQLLSDITK